MWLSNGNPVDVTLRPPVYDTISFPTEPESIYGIEPAIQKLNSNDKIHAAVAQKDAVVVGRGNLPNVALPQFLATTRTHCQRLNAVIEFADGTLESLPDVKEYHSAMRFRSTGDRDLQLMLATSSTGTRIPIDLLLPATVATEQREVFVAYRVNKWQSATQAIVTLWSSQSITPTSTTILRRRAFSEASSELVGTFVG
ncbi:MAG: hypothetical protein ACK5Q5_00975 [Planctomycetaceae bacterium]